jgi:hypothetical protein
MNGAFVARQHTAELQTASTQTQSALLPYGFVYGFVYGFEYVSALGASTNLDLTLAIQQIEQFVTVYLEETRIHRQL